MAARTRKVKHDDFTREKIRVSQLINRLESHAFDGTSMEATQIKAIEILLRKSLPDLSAITHEGGDAPLKMVVEWQRPKE